MVVFPNCKINLGLHIVRKRHDGYHDIETIFYPLPLNDVVEIVKYTGESSFSNSGFNIDAEPEHNLCLKAVQLLQKDFPKISGAKIHLHKAIPIGAGLGGGSSDGAFTLMLLNRKFNLGLSTEKLIDYALLLGSDCPFFIVNQPCLATARGEFLQKIQLDLNSYSIILVNPGIHISTAWAFSQLKPSASEASLLKIINQPPATWKDKLVNDFEEPVFANYPELQKIKQTLYDSGAIYASMTGSGSTIFGLFRKNELPELFGDSAYFIRKIE